jgi:cytochrome bd-type quinol oxidase subunit 2
VRRECNRYGLDLAETLRAHGGEEKDATPDTRRPWWDFAIPLVAIVVFVWFGVRARVPEMAMQIPFTIALIVILLVVLAACGWLLWKKTRFA